MAKKKLTSRGGFTLTELVITIMISTIVILAVGVILADSQRGWNTMYNRIYSDVVTDSDVARKAFDAVVREAGEGVSDGSSLEVHYYADANSTAFDRYARFYGAGGQLNVEHGTLNPKQTLSTRSICGNVKKCVFKVSGKSVQMILTLDDSLQTVTVVASSYMHN